MDAMSSPEHANRARGGESDHEHGPQVLVFDAFLAPDREALETLEARGYAVVRCGDDRSLLEEIVQRTPAVVVFGLRPNGSEEFRLLHLVRRTLPGVPLIVISDKGSLETQRLVQGFRPIYYGVSPLDAGELGEAVAAALEPRRRAAPTPRWTASSRGLNSRARIE